MRIRKIASKLLGSAMAYPSHHLSPYPDLVAAPALDVSGLVCELNQSPWDIYPNLHLFNTGFKDLGSSIISKKDEVKVELETKEEMQMVILENSGCISENTGALLENSDYPIRICQKRKRRSPTKKKENRKKKDAIILCKKNDGKKWFCKRAAQPPHSLCEYHLSQSRSYYNTNKEKEASHCLVECKSTKRKRKPRENGGRGASPYYYYNGFRPSTQKRRRDMISDGGGVHDVTLHLAEEIMLDACYVSDTGVDEECDEEIAGELASDPNEEEKRVPRKRRKLVKCRSLKSLL